MQSILTIVMSAIGVAVFFTLLCGVTAVWLAGKDPHRREQLFDTALELFRLGTTRFLGSIRGQGPRDHIARIHPPRGLIGCSANEKIRGAGEDFIVGVGADDFEGEFFHWGDSLNAAPEERKVNESQGGHRFIRIS